MIRMLGQALQAAFGSRDVLRSAAVVALVVSAFVGAIFSVALVVEALNSQSTLLQTVDSTLELQVRGFQQNRVRLSDVLSRPEASAPGRQLIWVTGAGGEIVGSHGQAPDLPAANRHVAAPTTVEIEGYRYRLAGGPVGDRWVVVGLNIEGFDLNRGGVVWPPWWLVPPGVIGVFMVSLLIGRWAAQPIERARRKQLAFAANASHELRTPLAVVEGEVSLALTRPRSADEYRAALERVSQETLHLRRLVDDLLWLARFESEPQAPKAEEINLVEAGRRSVERFRSLAHQKGLHLRFVEGGEAALSAPADWIDRLLGVLLDNACKYTPAGGEVCLTVAGSGERAELFVDDSGPGIPAGERERIFGRFQRAISNVDGAGLGLSIAAAVVGATRGNWTVATSPLGGARMGVSWRVANRVTSARRVMTA